MSDQNKKILDLNPIFKGDRTNIDFSFDFTPECLYADITFSSPLLVQGSVYEKASAARGSESLVMADFKISGSFDTLCARCLENITVTVDFTASYAVAVNLQNADDSGVLLAENGILDAGEPADALFFMNLPSKHLCSEDCKGICQGCGKNLNTEECACTKKNIDPRLAVLKKLLDK